MLLDYVNDMEVSVSKIKKGKEFFKSSLLDLGFKTLDTEGNFLHVDFGVNANKIHETLEKKVLYRAKFDHPSLSGYSRFTVAPKPVMERVVSLIKNVV